MKKQLMALAAALLAGAAYAETAVVNGITWTYTIQNDEAYITAAGVPKGTTRIIVPEQLGSCDVVSAGDSLFRMLDDYGVREIEYPRTLRHLGRCQTQFSGLERLIFLGDVPTYEDTYQGALGAFIIYGPICYVSCPREYGANWKKAISQVNRYGNERLIFAGFNLESARVEVISSSIRESDPTVLDVVYRVSSRKPTVKVRVLAFEDGERSFAKVVRPETFVADLDGNETAGNVGDAVTPNIEHTLSWRVSSDWQTKLAKVKFEVLACESELLPLELMTIPASDQYGKMKVSWNAIADSQWLDAMFWLYADKDSGLTLENGQLKTVADGLVLVNGTSVRTANGYQRWWEYGSYVTEYQSSVPEYVFGKMGYSLLSGDMLTYANAETRLGLAPSGARQYAYKIVEE